MKPAIDHQRRQQILDEGYFLSSIELLPEVRASVKARDWERLDRALQQETKPGGAIFTAMRQFGNFEEIEFIISIRSSDDVPDEDGIWHDDGSRVLAFSLSLTEAPEKIEGGRLEIRRRFLPGAVSAVLPTPGFGTLIAFATGVLGYEHKINRVAAGERIIAAGWCS